MTPLLVLLFGIHPATAVGTDLLQASITKAGGTYVHGRAGRVDWRITALLAAGSIPAALLTVLVMHRFGWFSTSRTITLVLGVALVLTAVALALRPHLRRFSKEHPPLAARPRVLTAAAGLVLGVVVTISSVGAGALGVTALFLLYPQLKTSRIVASDLAHAVPLTLVAGLGHWMFGSVDLHLLLSLLLGSLPGIYVGSHFAGRISETVAALAANRRAAARGGQADRPLEFLYPTSHEIPATAISRGGPRKRPQHHGRRAPIAHFAARRQPPTEAARGGARISAVRARGSRAHAHHGRRR